MGTNAIDTVDRPGGSQWLPFRGRTALFVAAWLALTALATCFDYPIAEWIVTLGESRRERLREVFRLAEFFGMPHIHILAAVILLALPNARRLLAGYAAAALVPCAVVTVLKMGVGRARPKLNIGPAKFHFLEYARGTLPPDLEPGFLSHETMWQSFPTGEGTGAFALATVLGLYFPRMRYAFWGLAAWTALSRVFLRMHFLSDVVFGAGMGILLVLAVARWLGPECYSVFPRGRER